MADNHDDNWTPGEDSLLPKGSRVRMGKESYLTKSDTPVTELERVKRQENRHHALVCTHPPCMEHQRLILNGKLLKVRMSLKPARNLWVPACGGCNTPMVWVNDDHVPNAEPNVEPL